MSKKKKSLRNNIMHHSGLLGELIATRFKYGRHPCNSGLGPQIQQHQSLFTFIYEPIGLLIIGNVALLGFQSVCLHALLYNRTCTIYNLGNSKSGFGIAFCKL